MALLIDLRNAIRPADGVPVTNQPIGSGLDTEIWKGNVYDTVRMMQEHIEAQEEAIDSLTRAAEALRGSANVVGWSTSILRGRSVV